MMEEKKIERGIIKYVYIYALIVALIIFFSFNFNIDYTVSFLLGVCTNLLCFTLTIKTIDKIVKYDDERKKSTLIKSNLRNYFVYLTILAVALVSQKYGDGNRIQLNIICTAIGFFSVKLMIYFKFLVVDKIFKKDKESKEEIVESKGDKDENNN